MSMIEEQIRLAHTAAVSMRRISDEAAKLKLKNRFEARLAARQAEESLAALQRSCRLTLARSRGWTAGKKWIPIESLIAGSFLRSSIQRISCYPAIDHPEYLIFNRRPIAVVSHTYGTWECCLQFAERHNLAAEKLPFSWYYPDVAMAVLFVRGSKLSI